MNFKEMSDDQLAALTADVFNELSHRKMSREKIEIRTLTINDVTVKDFAVEYCDYECSPKEKDYSPRFSFYIKHGGKKHCIYEDFSEHKKWWPMEKDEYEKRLVNAAYRFIPTNFAESSENSYEYCSSCLGDYVEEAITTLKEHGFEDITNTQDKV